ncbi:MAG: hypothetical protein AAGJ97_03395 [Planctomycetota bacterium]
MTAAELRKHVDRDPFEPFELRLTEGPPIPVTARNRILLSEGADQMAVIKPDDVVRMLHCRFVAGVAPLDSAASNP